MKYVFFLLIPGMLFIYTCKQEAETDPSNPFLSAWKTPFETPPFDQIKNEHFLPAFTEGFNQQNNVIIAILSNGEEATFDNTILPLDKSGDLLSKVKNVFFNLESANTDDEKQAIAREIAPMLSAHNDDITMNEELFNRINAVYEKRNSSGLDHSQVRVVEKYYEMFVRNGANLSPEDKNKLREMNEELTGLSVKFGQNLLAETNDSFRMVIENKDDLASLTDNAITGAAEAAREAGLDGKWLFTLHKPSWIPFLQFSDKRDLREKIYRGWFMRGNNNNEYDNKYILKRIAELRALRAALLGYKDHATYQIE
ncbi:MAG TPA: M3 family metallopeptidase, partial [Cyclobacteriaceae bacterium]|nr:M3 family metallopeptidase [Cyclobacteriaceae bacterium]